MNNYEGPFSPDTKLKSNDFKTYINSGGISKNEDLTQTIKNISDRIMQIPIKETTLDNSIGFIDNKLFYLKWPISGSREDGWYSLEDSPKGVIYYFDLNTLEEKLFFSGATSFNIDNESSNIVINSNDSITVCSTKNIPNKDSLATNMSFKPSLANFFAFKKLILSPNLILSLIHI